ncbi:M14 family metallopeptidase [Methylosinus sp. Sm6]|uniref:M14 family metallopeptidase n=1 Tax=Methylosinus sp. Sm6 TaxID=2866948 RepID=UPI001C99472D|nr:M14 family metallopeptidase [Methylosinus sp. Sm6]MBY6241743.1 M14 family metallopeptidase [Methylosinus sp. Sm6]
MSNDVDSFSRSYAQARDKFRAAVDAAGGALEVFEHPGRGPDGEALTTDVAWVGPRTDRALVLISGTHGVEGYCGSGAQIDWLRRGGAANASVGVLLIHAINPHGFAWTRRVNEDNVDLNRNWVDFPPRLSSNPDYAELADDLCPAQWTPEAQKSTTERLLAWRAARGDRAFQKAVSIGQYSHPLGLFYGGKEPSWSRRTQSAIFRKHLAGARRVAVIDYHTGLGPEGYAERLSTDAPGTAEFARASCWYGAAVTSTKIADATQAGEKSASEDVTGDNLIGSAKLLPGAEFTGIAFEVGTAPILEVMQALRADAWLHAYGDPNSEAGRTIESRMRSAFYRETDFWKGMVAGQSLLTIRQAIAGLMRE